ncbi:hypothetical protein DL93DRAFT_2228560 [Clavulina sp. PMI_390]|nr:hypothetical protein DL93DRAFT_2228560 [Clavulina sp. PMI_390]
MARIVEEDIICWKRALSRLLRDEHIPSWQFSPETMSVPRLMGWCTRRGRLSSYSRRGDTVILNRRNLALVPPPNTFKVFYNDNIECFSSESSSVRMLPGGRFVLGLFFSNKLCPAWAACIWDCRGAADGSLLQPIVWYSAPPTKKPGPPIRRFKHVLPGVVAYDKQDDSFIIIVELAYQHGTNSTFVVLKLNNSPGSSAPALYRVRDIDFPWNRSPFDTHRHHRGVQVIGDHMLIRTAQQHVTPVINWRTGEVLLDRLGPSFGGALWYFAQQLLGPDGRVYHVQDDLRIAERVLRLTFSPLEPVGGYSGTLENPRPLSPSLQSRYSLDLPLPLKYDADAQDGQVLVAMTTPVPCGNGILFSLYLYCPIRVSHRRFSILLPNSCGRPQILEDGTVCQCSKDPCVCYIINETMVTWYYDTHALEAPADDLDSLHSMKMIIARTHERVPNDIEIFATSTYDGRCQPHLKPQSLGFCPRSGTWLFLQECSEPSPNIRISFFEV